MRTSAAKICGVALAALMLVPAVVPAGETEPAPDKALVEVVYYFLPG